MSLARRTSVQPSNIGRPAYEAISAFVFAAFGAGYLIWKWLTDDPSIIPLLCGGLLFAAGTVRLVQACRHWSTKARLILGRPYTTSVDTILRKQRRAGARFLGKGFVWEPRHAGRIHEIHAHPGSKLRWPPHWFRWLLIKTGRFLPPDHNSSVRYIHGCSASETDLYMPHSGGGTRTLMVGSSGYGKTRLLEQLIVQDLSRIDDTSSRTKRPGPLILFDPKGDEDLLDRIYSLARATGRERDFHVFRPSSPETSVRIDLLGSISQPTQIADALRSLLPTQGEAETFAGFAWQYLYTVVSAMQRTGHSVSLARLGEYLNVGLDGIVEEWLHQHLSSLSDEYPNWESWVDTQQGRAKPLRPNENGQSRRLAALAAFYFNKIAFEHRLSDLTSAIGILRNNPEHLKKLTALLFPLIDKLTSGPLSKLLSPFDYPDDRRPALTFQNILDRSSIVVIQTGALKDAAVAQALGGLSMTALVRCAAKRQSHAISYPPIHVIVDEAAEMMNEPFIQALNKGRSVGLELTVAAQTLPDFEAGLGSTARASQVLGNFNNVICMRAGDETTLQFMEDLCGTTTFEARQKSLSVAHRHSGAVPSAGTDSTAVSSVSETIPIVSKELLSRLPPGEFFCYRSGGTVLKGRTLLMDINDEERLPVVDTFDFLAPGS